MTWGRDTDEHEARDQLIAFAEAGGTLVDTAAGYGDGASEELIGTLIGDVVARDEVVLATKAGISRRTRRARSPTPRAATCSRTLDASLRRLGVDHVDLWQVHIWADETPLEETLTRARPRGEHRPGVVRRRLELHRLADRPGRDLAARGARPGAAGVAPRWSTRCSTARVEHEVLPAAAALGLGVLPWSPLGRGVLTGKYRTGTPSDSARRLAALRELRRAPTSTSASRGIVEAVARAADGLGWTPLEVALAWVRDRPGVTAPIVGARTAAQLRGALGVEDKSLPAEIMRRPRRRLGEQSMSQALSRRGPAPGVEWEFDKLTFSREFSRNVVTKLLVERAEHGGWELDRVRIGPDGTRRVVLRRKIIRAVRTASLGWSQPSRLAAVGHRTASRRRAQTSSRNRSKTRAPNSSASTGTRSSTPWKSAVKSRSAGSRSGAKP